MKKISILVYDDHEILLKGIVQLLKLEKSFEVVGEARDGREACQLEKEKQPDVILMDINMPICSGIEATSYIRQYNQQVKIIMLTISEQEEDLFDAIRSGANGYLLKNINMEELFHNVKKGYEGDPVFSPGLANIILKEFSQITGNQDPEDSSGRYGLSDREQQVLELVAIGKTNRYIADKLFISEHTVKKHLQHILEKLHVNNRVEAAAVAMQEGLIEQRDFVHESI